MFRPLLLHNIILADMALLLLLLMLQLDALVSSVAANSSIRSLSLHGVTLNLYASHQLLLDTLVGLKPLSPGLGRVQQQHVAAASNSASAGQPQQPIAASSNSVSGGQPQSLLQHVDLSFTKHCAVAPAGLSLSKIWSRIKKQQHDAAMQQQLGTLNQMKGQLVQFHDAAVAAAAAGAPPLPPEIAATAVAAALALVIDGDAAAAVALQQQLDAALQVPQLQGAGPGQQQQQQQAAQQVLPDGAAGAGMAAGFAMAAAGMMAGLEGPGNDGLTLLNQTMMQLDQQIHMLTQHSPHTVSEMTMGHASAASAADKLLIELLQDALRARGVSELSVRMHGSSAADKPGQHGVGAGVGHASWGGSSGSKRVSDGGDSDDDSSDGEGPSMATSSSSLAVKPSMGLGFFESSGIYGVLDGLGSFAASCLAFTTVTLAHGARSAAGQRRTSWLGKALSFVQLGFSVGLTFTVALIAAVSTRFASAEELEHLRAAGYLPSEAHDNTHDGEQDEEDSSEWEEIEQDEVMEEEPVAVEPVQDHPAPGIGQEEGGGGGGEFAGVMQAAVAAAANVVGGPAAAMLAGGGAGGLLPAAAPHLNEQFVDQGIQDLLNPEGEDQALAAADANGGMTGIPAQVQVVASMNNAASWAFMAGAAPVSALGVWLWARQLKWALFSVVVPVARYVRG
jgi:hypothetical protein